MKKRTLKKMLKYKIVSRWHWLGDHYQVSFIFKGQELKLDYWLKSWDLTTETFNGEEILNSGETIEECCNYLFEGGKE